MQAEWISSHFDAWPQGDLAVSASTLALIGVLYCFLGYRLIKFVLGLTGFLFAAAPVAVIAAGFAPGHTVAVLVAAIAGGICGAVALLFLFQLGVFALAGAGSGLVAYHLLYLAPQPWTPWAVAGVACLGGLLALLLERPIVSMATAAIGAWLLTSATFLAAGGAARWMEIEDVEPQWFKLAGLGLWVLLTILGVFTQGLRQPREH